MKRELTKNHPRIAHHRRSAAALAREIRAMWPSLTGSWRRREWNAQARLAARHHVKNAVWFDRANQPEVLA